MKLYLSLAVIVAACITTPVLTQQQQQASSSDNGASYCRDPKTREGTCVPIKECQTLIDEVLTKRNDETFKRYLRASNRICGGTDRIVCCPSKTQTGATISSPLIKSTSEIPTRLPTAEEGCGISNHQHMKIVGGEVSKKGAWPWVALLGYNEDVFTTPFKCGGSLITARHIITAAHCVIKGLSFARLGEHDLTTDTEAQHVDIRVVRSERHPDYSRRFIHNDIAILYLERNVEFTQFISPICMPLTEEYRQKSYVNYNPFVVGWGKTTEGGASANVLQELQVPVFENKMCRAFYTEVNRLITENQFDKTVICAGVLAGGMDTCQGDSGGPLMIPEKYNDALRYYLIGVVSYGVGCARPNIPSVYSSTQNYMDWIIQKIADTP